MFAKGWEIGTSASRTLVAVTVLSLSTLGGLPANADTSEPEDSTHEILSAVQKVAPVGVMGSLEDAGAVLKSSDTSLNGAVQSSELVIPKDAGGAVQLRGNTASGSVAFSFSMPTEAKVTGSGTVVSNAVVFEGTGEVDVAMQLVTGGVRVQTVLNSVNAPTTYSYAISDGAMPEVLDDGSIGIVLSTDDGPATVVGNVLKTPWAFDAEGTPVSTHYEVSGNSVVQIVDHRAADYVYPIVADPEWGWEGILLWAYLNHQETADVAAGDTSAVVCAPPLVLGGPVIAALCAANAASVNIKATQAVNRGTCIKVSFGPGVVSASFYNGAHCW